MSGYRALIGAAVVVASFAYGIGVGRYNWPPAALLKSTRNLILGSKVAPVPSQPHAAYTTARSSIFQNTSGRADVVMLGDSITESGNWQEILPDIKVMNRGISGDQSGGVLARVPEVISRQPRQVFLMIGVNDLRHGGTPERTAENIGRIIRALQEAQISPILQSVLFVGDGYLDLNPPIQRLNDILRDMARETSVPFIDLNAVLAPSGRLASEFTFDGVHLSGAAYIRWRDAIMPFINTASRG